MFIAAAAKSRALVDDVCAKQAAAEPRGTEDEDRIDQGATRCSEHRRPLINKPCRTVWRQPGQKQQERSQTDTEPSAE